MKQLKYIIAAILLVSAGFAVGYMAKQDSIEDMQYYNLSGDKLYNPTFKVCRIEYETETGFFHADNSSRCQQMNPWNMQYQ